MVLTVQPMKVPTRLIALTFALILQLKPNVYAQQEPCANFGSEGLASSLESNTTHLSALTVLGNGKIIAVGYYDNNTDSDFLVVRYNSNGTPDLTFGSDGVRLYDLSSSKNDKANCVAVASDGNVLVGGVSEGYGTMIKIDANGNLMAAFGNNGVLKYGVLYSSIESIAVSATGSIYAAGKNINTENIVILQLQVKAFDANGQPLLTFSGDGIYDDAEFLVWHESVIRTVLQSDGKLVVAGTTIGPNASFDIWTLVRLNSNGTVDTDFGNSGRAEDPETAESQLNVLKLGSDGALYAGGYSNQSPETASQAVVKKFKTNGNPETSFNMTGSAVHLLAGNNAIFNTLAVDQDGNVFVGGARGAAANDREFILAAFDPAGEPDNGFGVPAGKINGMSTGEVLDMVRLSDGSFVVCGYAESPGHHYGVLRKHAPDGSVVTTFNNGGAAFIRFIEDGEAHSVVVQPDGKIVVGGVYLQNGSNTGIVVARFLSNGSPDMTFGTFGYVKYDLTSRREFLTHLVLLPDGKFLAGGTINDANYGDDYLVVKLNSDGSLDTDFGTGGYFKKHVGAYGKHNTLNQIAVDPQGRILIAGDANYLGGSYVDATLMRLLENGAVDTDFADNGIFRKQLTSVNDFFTDVVVADDGAIYVTGNGTVNVGAVVVKLTDGGLPASGFGSEGTVFINWSDDKITRATDIVFQPDGKLVVSCTRRDPDDVFGGSSFIYRMNADGTPDAALGDQGKLDLPILGGNETPRGLLVDASGVIYVSGLFSPAEGRSFFLVKLNPDGSEAATPYKNRDIETSSGIALNLNAGNIYSGVSPDGLGGMHVICLGPAGSGPACDEIPDPTITRNGETLTASDGDSYQWYLNGMAIDGETGQTYTDPVVGGTYTVQVTIGSCVLFSDDYDYLVTSVPTGELNIVNVYPNPFNSAITIRSSRDLSGSRVAIYTLAGTLIHAESEIQGNQVRVSLNDLNPGAYLMTIESQSQRKFVKLLKQ